MLTICLRGGRLAEQAPSGSAPPLPASAEARPSCALFTRSRPRAFRGQPAFLGRLGDIRRKELAVVRSSAAVRAGLGALLGVAPTLVFAATLLAYNLLGGTLRPSTVFASLTLFNQLRFPLLFLPVVLSQLADAKVASTKI